MIILKQVICLQTFWNLNDLIFLYSTPHNPVGKVFTKEELEDIAQVVKKHNLLVIADEVYDTLYFKPTQHVRLASLEGMYERTVTVGSAGKTFSATGWRLGWLMGPSNLISPILAATTRVTFTTVSPLQEAVASALQNMGDYLEVQRDEYIERRTVLMEALDRLGLPYTVPDGSYFILVNIDKLNIPKDFKTLDLIEDRTEDWRAAWFFAQIAKVVVIPPTVRFRFFSPLTMKLKRIVSGFLFS